jgi:hypothetical protein
LAPSLEKVSTAWAIFQGLLLEAINAPARESKSKISTRERILKKTSNLFETIEASKSTLKSHAWLTSVASINQLNY